MRRGCKNSIIFIFTNVCFRESSNFHSELIKVLDPAACLGNPITTMSVTPSQNFNSSSLWLWTIYLVLTCDMLIMNCQPNSWLMNKCSCQTSTCHNLCQHHHLHLFLVFAKLKIYIYVLKTTKDKCKSRIYYLVDV